MIISIYQIKETVKDIRHFDPWEYAKKTFSFNNYYKVYEGEMHGTNDNDILENAYVSGNIGKLRESYIGHSISVGDIIKINNKYYFCDSFGWKNITKFINKT